MKKLFCLISICIVFLNSCCTLRKDSYEKVYINSNPSGAEVIIDGCPRGVTPRCFPVKAKQSHDIVLEKEGYQPQHYTLHSRVSPKRLSSNIIFPIGVGLAGTAAALAYTGGSIANLSGIVVWMGALAGIAAGTLIGVAGVGIDAYSGKANQLSSRKIQADLRPIPYCP